MEKIKELKNEGIIIMMKLRPDFLALLMASKKAKANNGNKPKEQPKTTSK